MNSKEDFKTLSMTELQEKLGSSPDGLSQTEAKKRLTQYGPNEIEEKKGQSTSKIPFLFLGAYPVDDRSSCNFVRSGSALAGFFHHPSFAGCQRSGWILGGTRGWLPNLLNYGLKLNSWVESIKEG